MNPNRRDEDFEAFKAGDEKAFKKYLDLYNHDLYIMAFNRTVSEDIAKDIVIDAFAKLWEFRARINDPGHIKGFLYIVVRNGTIGEFRYQKKTQELIKDLMHVTDLTYTDPAEHELYMDQMLGELHQLIDCLPPKRRQVFIYRHILQEDVKTIAQSMHLRRQTVLNQLSRAVKFLRQSIKK